MTYLFYLTLERYEITERFCVQLPQLFVGRRRVFRWKIHGWLVPVSSGLNYSIFVIAQAPKMKDGKIPM